MNQGFHEARHATDLMCRNPWSIERLPGGFGGLGFVLGGSVGAMEPKDMGPLRYHSHSRIPKDMGMLWE